MNRSHDSALHSTDTLPHALVVFSCQQGSHLTSDPRRQD